MIQVFGTFEHSIKLELALSALDLAGIHKENIFAIPLTNRKVDRRILDTLHNSDGLSLTSTGFAVATAFAVIGCSVGFALAWGPIYWGLIGAATGFTLGFLIDLVINRILKPRNRRLKGKNPQVILVVECSEEKADTIEDIFWHHLALGTARVKLSGAEPARD